MNFPLLLRVSSFWTLLCRHVPRSSPLECGPKFTVFAVRRSAVFLVTFWPDCQRREGRGGIQNTSIYKYQCSVRLHTALTHENETPAHLQIPPPSLKKNTKLQVPQKLFCPSVSFSCPSALCRLCSSTVRGWVDFPRVNT